MQKVLFILSFLFLFLSSTVPSFGSLRINEFSSHGSSDWIEIYNDGSDSVDLSSYRVRDSSASNKLDLSGSISSHGFATFDWSDNLNNGGDIIKILLISDESNVIDQMGYGSLGSDVAAPLGGQSAGRQSDGGSGWVLFGASSKGASNNSSQQLQPPTPTPTNAPTHTKTITPTKTPTPVKSPTPTKLPTPTKISSKKVIESSSDKVLGSTVKKVNAAKESTKNHPTAILAEKDAATADDEKEDKNVLLEGKQGMNPNVVPVVIVGSLCFIACAILLILTNRRKLNASRND